MDQPVQQRRQGLDAVPGPQAPDEAQDGPSPRFQRSPDLRFRRPGRKSSVSTPLGTTWTRSGLDAERDRVFSQGSPRRSAPRRRAEGPAFRLGGEVSESGRPVGRLLQGERRVQLQDQGSVQLAGQRTPAVA